MLDTVPSALHELSHLILILSVWVDYLCDKICLIWNESLENISLMLSVIGYGAFLYQLLNSVKFITTLSGNGIINVGTLILRVYDF